MPGKIPGIFANFPKNRPGKKAQFRRISPQAFTCIIRGPAVDHSFVILSIFLFLYLKLGYPRPEERREGLVERFCREILQNPDIERSRSYY